MQASFLLHRKKKWNGRLDLPACDIKGGQRFPLYPSRQWNIYLTLLHPATTTTPLPPEKYQSYLLLFRRRRSICGLLFCGEERQVQKGRSLQRKSPSSSFSLQLFPCPFLSCLLPSRPSSNILLCSFLTQHLMFILLLHVHTWEASRSLPLSAESKQSFSSLKCSSTSFIKIRASPCLHFPCHSSNLRGFLLFFNIYRLYAPWRRKIIPKQSTIYLPYLYR